MDGAPGSKNFDLGPDYYDQSKDGGGGDRKSSSVQIEEVNSRPPPSGYKSNLYGTDQFASDDDSFSEQDKVQRFQQDSDSQQEMYSEENNRYQQPYINKKQPPGGPSRYENHLDDDEVMVDEDEMNVKMHSKKRYPPSGHYMRHMPGDIETNSDNSQGGYNRNRGFKNYGGRYNDNDSDGPDSVDSAPNQYPKTNQRNVKYNHMGQI